MPRSSSTVAVNLKDCPPFGRPASNDAAGEKLCQQGEAALAQGRFAEAETAFQQALGREPQNAGRALTGDRFVAPHHSLAAREQFQRALMTIRCRSAPIPASTKSFARRRSGAWRAVVLCDAAEALRAGQSAGRGWGRIVLGEHVHLGSERQLRLARVAEQVEQRLTPALKRDARSARFHKRNASNGSG